MRGLLRMFRRRSRAEHDFAEEVESHIASETERLAAEGWSEHAAAHEARRRFGNVGAAHERFHDARTNTYIESFAHDVRYGVRALRRAPVFTAVAVLSLALGIGANTAVFTFVNAVLFKQLPVQEPSQLVWVSTDPRFRTMDYPTIARFRTAPSPFAGVAGVYSLDRANVSVDRQPADPRTVRVHLVTGDYFTLFGLHATRGRLFTMDDERVLDGHPVTVISDAYWRTHFAQMPDVLGHTVTINETAFTVIGVTSPSFMGDELGEPAELWIPIMMQSEVMPERPNVLLTPRSWVRMLARLKPGVTSAQAAGIATQRFRQTLRETTQMTPGEVAGVHLALASESRGFAPSRSDASAPMVVVWAIVALVLAIACVNVSALLLVRAAVREREITTRLALGASSGRIMRLLLTEGALIGGAASLLGIGVAILGIRWLERVAASGMTPYQLDVAPDARVFALTLGASLLAMLVCGIVPARRAAHLSVSSGLRGSRSTGGRGITSRARLGRALVVAQVALALVLVVAAGLFTRTLTRLEHQDIGFDRDHVLEAFAAPDQANISGERLANLFDAATLRIGALPGVRSVAVSSRGLLTRYAGMVRTTVPGYTKTESDPDFVAYNYVTRGFFSTAGMTLMTGRDLQSDDVTGHPRVAIISESMAKHYFGTVNALGKRFGIARDVDAPIEVVGIVRDAKDGSLRDANIDMMYLPYRQDASRLTQMRVIVRTDGDPAVLAASVRRVLHDLDPSLPVTAVEPIRNQMGRTIAMERFTAVASAFFGGVALLLAALGMFAMVSHAVVTRTSEIGIRMALGGSRGSVVRMILRENFVLVAIGLVFGLGLALVATRAAAAQLFNVSPADLGTYVAAITIMLGTAFAAVLLPAGRATRVDPATTLRHE